MKLDLLKAKRQEEKGTAETDHIPSGRKYTDPTIPLASRVKERAVTYDLPEQSQERINKLEPMNNFLLERLRIQVLYSSLLPL